MRILILAGGGGTRLWPLSRQDFPKQFLRFNDSLSLLQKTVSRFLSVSFIESIVVGTNAQYRELVEVQLSKIDSKKVVEILVEPVRRNTAAAIALGVKYFQERMRAENDSSILVISSDHLIEPESVFLRFLAEVEPFSQKNRIILFGIRPNRAEEGYGYIQIGKKDEGPLYSIKRFVEKPNRQHAEQYLASGDYYWNAGIFIFSPRTFWREIQSHAPALFQKMQGNFSVCLEQFSQLPDQSIDYAVIEKTKHIAICPLPISWSDIGSWDGVYEALDKDQNQNVKIGNVLEINTKNSLIIGGDRLISTIGLEDVLIIETNEVLFISKKGESQKVKEIVQELMKTGQKERFLHTQPLCSWGLIKLLYSGDGFQIFNYRIWAMQSFVHEAKSDILQLLIVLKGAIELIGENTDLHLGISQSIRLEGQCDLKVNNTLEEEAEVMLVSYHLQKH